MKHYRKSIFLLPILLGLHLQSAKSANVSVPHLFLNGEVISATRFNENFNTLVQEHNSKESRISAIESSGWAGTSRIADSAVTTAKINDSAVTTNKINDSAVTLAKIANAAQSSLNPQVMCCRLSLSNTSAITTSDQQNKTTVYLLPYRGNRIPLYDGTNWLNYTLSAAISVNVPATVSTPFDIFVYSNAGVLTLEAIDWANDTTRATALVDQDGVLVQTGSLTHRYVGTARTTTINGETEDSIYKRYLWNYYNRAPRELRATEQTDSWSYNVAAYRQANNDSANQVETVIGVTGETLIRLQALARYSNDSATAASISIGDNSNVNPATGVIGQNGGSDNAIAQAYYTTVTAAGYRYWTWLERGNAAGTTTWYGDDADSTLTQSGLFGWLEN